MKAVLEKLYQGDKEQLVQDLLQCYKEQAFCIVNFIYFSNIVAQNLFNAQERSNNQDDYRKILLKGDFLLPDGIAVQIFYFCANLFHVINTPKKRLDNLNGTDFSSFFLERVREMYGNHKICLLMYGAKETEVEKARKYIAYKGFNVIYAQDGYSDFEREKAEEKLEEYQDTVNVLLVGRSTPTNPLQEMRTLKNYQKIKKNNLIVMNVWGLFDRWAWSQKRAPKRIRTIKLEWLRRLISDPKRNLKKVLNSLQIIPYIFRYLVLKKK